MTKPFQKCPHCGEDLFPADLRGYDEEGIECTCGGWSRLADGEEFSVVGCDDPVAGQILLRSDIVDSELWRKPTHIVLAWLTMALSCDEDYHVDGSLPWLATAANISLEELLEALADLSAPCPHFASESNPDGILVEETEVGWRLVVDPENPLFIPSGDAS